MEKTRVIRLIVAENISQLQDDINKFLIMYSGTDPHVSAMLSDFDYAKGTTIYFACVEYNILKNETEKK